jgi:biopolymer transport protein ExbB/TolQ
MLDFCLDILVNLWEAVENLWRSTDRFGRGDVALLAVMLVNVVVLVSLRLFRHSIARKQTHAFTLDAAAALRDGRFDELIATAARNRGSHVATVVAAGVTAFVSAPPQYTHKEASEAAERAMQRSRKINGAALKVGLGTFTTTAWSAPFIGLLGMCFGILYAFRGYVGERHYFIVRLTSDFATALVMTAMGLLVAIFAMWFRNWHRSRIEVLQTEMSNAAIETIACLNAHPLWRNQPENSAVGTINTGPVVANFTEACSQAVPYDRQRVLLLAIWAYWLYIALSAVLRW